MNSEPWITVKQMNGDKECFNYVENFSIKDLKQLLDDSNPNVSMEIINGSDVLKDNFLFDQNTRYVLDLLKTRSLYSYHQELYDLLYDKTIEVTEREIYYCYLVEYCDGMFTLKMKSIRNDNTDRTIVYHREFYYRQDRPYLDFDRYHGEYGLIVDRFEEFGNSFEIELREFMDEIIRKCKSEEDKRGSNLIITFKMPDDRDEIIDCMDITIGNNYVDNFESDEEYDYHL